MVVSGTGTWRMWEGFEHQSLDLVQASVGSPTFTGGRTGRAVQLSAETTAESIDLPLEWNNTQPNTRAQVNETHLLICFSVLFSDLSPPSDQNFFVILDGNGALLFQLRLATGGDLVLIDQNGTLHTESGPFTVNTHHFIEFMFEHAATTADYELRLDGAVLVAASDGDFLVDGADDPDIARFTGQTTGGDVTVLDDYGVKSRNGSDISFPSDDAGAPFFEVYGFQGGVAATESGSWDSGSMASIDEIPVVDSDFVEINGTNGINRAAADAGGDADVENGPSGNGNINDLHGNGANAFAQYYWRAQRTNGSSPTGLNLRFGQWTSGGGFITNFQDILSLLSSSQFDPFFQISALNHNPESDEFAVLGLHKNGSGGRDIRMSGGLVQVANAPALGIAIDQDAYRWSNDDGTEVTATYNKAANTLITVGDEVGADFDFGDVLRLRILYQETSGTAGVDQDAQLQYRVGAGGWNDVNAASSVARSIASQLVDAADTTTTRRLGSGTFVTPNDGQDEGNGLAGGTDLDPGANEEWELEFSFQIIGADVSDAESITFRVLHDGAAPDTTTQTPTITIDKVVTGPAIPVVYHHRQRNF